MEYKIINGPCPYECNSKTSTGHCSLTACTNPKYNGSGTWIAKTCQNCFYTWMVKVEDKDTKCPRCERK